jgi:Cysteine dioxygenase type I
MPTQSRWVAPTPLSIRELVHLTGEIAAEVAAGRHEVRFDPVQRWHTRLRAGAYADIWLISWPRYQAAELHDHGGSIGALTVVQGTLTEHRWLPADRGGNLVPRRLRTGAHAGFPVGYVHDVVNVDPEPALSVHAYSPPLTAMSYYEIDDSDALRRIRTLLTDDPEPTAAGAGAVA